MFRSNPLYLKLLVKDFYTIYKFEVTMKALLLCAGMGERVKPLSNNIPKPLIEINKKSLLERILKQLECFNIKDIFIVVGYKKELIKDRLKNKFKLNIHCIDNPLYNKLNNLFSVWLSKSYLFGEEFLLINGDIIFDIAIMELILNSKIDNFSVIDISQPLPEDSMKVKIDNGEIVDFGKEIRNGDGFTVGIHKFSKEGSKTLFQEMDDMIKKGEDGYHHAAILNIIKKDRFRQKALLIKNILWCEIDEISDVKRAEKMFKR